MLIVHVGHGYALSWLSLSSCRLLVYVYTLFSTAKDMSNKLELDIFDHLFRNKANLHLYIRAN